VRAHAPEGGGAAAHTTGCTRTHLVGKDLDATVGVVVDVAADDRERRDVVHALHVLLIVAAAVAQRDESSDDARIGGDFLVHGVGVAEEVRAAHATVGEDDHVLALSRRDRQLRAQPCQLAAVARPNHGASERGGTHGTRVQARRRTARDGRHGGEQHVTAGTAGTARRARAWVLVGTAPTCAGPRLPLPPMPVSTPSGTPGEAEAGEKPPVGSVVSSTSTRHCAAGKKE
jgi:hypothetical protein